MFITIGFGLAVPAALAYLIFGWNLSRSWQKLPLTFAAGKTPYTFVSVIVPARNEAGNIISCIQSILGQDYPPKLFELLVVDDHSEDNTVGLVRSLSDPRIRLLQAHAGNSGKKKALNLGIQEARGTLIVTTDADCVAPPGWLTSVVAVYESENPAFIASPVVFSQDHSPLERFQALDFLGTMILTGVGIHKSWFYLANGANLAFPKKIFLSVGGYEGIDRLASGDDMLLLHKIALEYPGRISFNKSREATVVTRPESGFRDFFWQRIRWAGKTGTYTDRRLQSLVVGVFFLSAYILLAPIVLLLTGTNTYLWKVYLLVVALKFLADWFILDTGMKYFSRKDLRSFFLQAQLYHLLYITGIGSLSLLLKKYPWKGRKLR